MKVWRSHYIKCCLIGSTGALGFAPVGVTSAFLLSFAWFFYGVIATPKKQIKYAIVFLLCFYMANLYWVTFPLTIDISRHGVLIPIAIIAIPLYLVLQLLLPLLITKSVDGIYQKALIFSAASCSIMCLFGYFSLGFPWVLPGYAWCHHEIFMQTLSIYGIYGLSLVTMLISTFLGAAYVFYKNSDHENASVAVCVSAILVIFIAVFGITRTIYNPTQYTQYNVRLVQCNLSQHDKSNRKLAERNFFKHIYHSSHGSEDKKDKKDKIDFIIWPEASIPYLYSENMSALNEVLRSPLSEGSFLIMGAVREDLASSKIYNSCIVINHRGRNVAKYDKTRLVPFGEYIPFRSLTPFPFRSIASDIGDFDVGEKKTNRLLRINGLNIAVGICYECAFPLWFVRSGDCYFCEICRSCEGSPSIDLIINLTNDGWFGFTSEPFQHLEICRSRAIEIGAPLIRVTNFGISAVFDAFGREIAKIDINTENFLDSRIPRKHLGQTVYMRYGDNIFWLMIIFLIAVVIFMNYSSRFRL